MTACCVSGIKFGRSPAFEVEAGCVWQVMVAEHRSRMKGIAAEALMLLMAYAHSTLVRAMPQGAPSLLQRPHTQGHQVVELRVHRTCLRAHFDSQAFSIIYVCVSKHADV